MELSNFGVFLVEPFSLRVWIDVFCLTFVRFKNEGGVGVARVDFFCDKKNKKNSCDI